MKVKKGQTVFWKWMGKLIQGKVLEITPETVKKTIKGKAIVRHGTKDNPAVLVISEAGNEALKLSSELLSEDTSVAANKNPHGLKLFRK